MDALKSQDLVRAQTNPRNHPDTANARLESGASVLLMGAH
jgi:hypothetical protein